MISTELYCNECKQILCEAHAEQHAHTDLWRYHVRSMPLIEAQKAHTCYICMFIKDGMNWLTIISFLDNMQDKLNSLMSKLFNMNDDKDAV